MPENNGVAYLSTDLGKRSDRYIASHFSAHVEVRPFPQRERPADQCAFLNNAVFTQIYRARLCIENGGLDVDALFNKYVCGSVESCVWIDDAGGHPVGSDQLKIGFDLLSIELKDLPQLIHDCDRLRVGGHFSGNDFRHFVVRAAEGNHFISLDKPFS